MAERIVRRDAENKPIAVEGGRVQGKVYSQIGTDEDGTVVLLEWKDEDISARRVEEAAWKPRPITSWVGFADRLSDDEYKSIMAAIDTSVSVAGNRWFRSAIASNMVDLTDPRLMAILQRLVTSGKLLPARMTEILAQ